MALLAFSPTSRLSELAWILLDLTRTLLLTGPSLEVRPGNVGRPLAILRSGHFPLWHQTTVFWLFVFYIQHQCLSHACLPCRCLTLSVVLPRINSLSALQLLLLNREPASEPTADNCETWRQKLPVAAASQPVQPD